MIHFDWDVVEKVSKKNINVIINIIYWLTYKTIPYNKKEPIYKIFTKDYYGDSYLINPDSLFYYKNRKFTKIQMVDYIFVASKRSFNQYYFDGIKTLPLDHSPLNLSRIRNNPLFTITKKDIKFRFEDTKKWQ